MNEKIVSKYYILFQEEYEQLYLLPLKVSTYYHNFILKINEIMTKFIKNLN
jgi:hypothetical protein